MPSLPRRIGAIALVTLMASVAPMPELLLTATLAMLYAWAVLSIPR